MTTRQSLKDLDLSLVELINVYKLVLGAMQQQRAALASRDISALDMATSEIRSLLKRARDAETIRDQHALALAGLAGPLFADSRPTLKDLVALAETSGEADLALSLRQSHTQLVNLLAAVRDVHEGNAAIIQRRMSYGRFVMGMLSTATGYSADGTRKAVTVSRVSIKA